MCKEEKTKVVQQFLHLGWKYSVQIIALDKEFRLRLFHRRALLREVKPAPELEKAVRQWTKPGMMAILQRRVKNYLICLNQKSAARELRYSAFQQGEGSQTPPDAIFDYIMFHELCKLVYPKGGSKFRILLALLLPHYKKSKKCYEQYSFALNS